MEHEELFYLPWAEFWAYLRQRYGGDSELEIFLQNSGHSHDSTRFREHEHALLLFCILHSSTIGLEGFVSPLFLDCSFPLGVSIQLLVRVC